MADLISWRTTLNASMAFSAGACGGLSWTTSAVARSHDDDQSFIAFCSVCWTCTHDDLIQISQLLGIGRSTFNSLDLETGRIDFKDWLL